MDPRGFVLFNAIFPALLLAVLAGTGLLVGRLPARFVNLPHRDYWLAPERLAATRAKLLAHLAVMATLTLLLFAAIAEICLHLARTGGDRLPAAFFWALGLFLAATSWTSCRSTGPSAGRPAPRAADIIRRRCAPSVPWLAVLLLLGAASAAAWLTPGHRRVAIDAVAALPAEFPAFFRAGAATVGHLSVDPDLHKNPGTPELRSARSPSTTSTSNGSPAGRCRRRAPSTSGRWSRPAGGPPTWASSPTR